jgi:DHA1 family bicyclomycin/chloramphenicol resistance-like MFS transporter
MTSARFRGLRLPLVLGAVTALAPLSVDMYLPALPSLSDDLETATSQVQLTLTTCLAGLALGQVLAGPLSDALGRKRPLLGGLAAYVAATLLCAAAPSVHALSGLRLVQGLAGAAGIVIARAIVRDVHSGVAAAQVYSLLMLVNGIDPILAPVIGGQLLHVVSWRGIFLVLAGYGVALFAVAAVGLRETLPAASRRVGGVRDTAATFHRLLLDPSFLAYSLACGLVFAAMFAYISGSPFVLQDVYGVSPQLYGVLFGLNALGIVAAGQLNRSLVARVGVRRMLVAGLLLAVAGGVGLVVSVWAGLGLAGILPSLFATVSSIGIVMPNATALALAEHPDAAGTASGLLGVLQFLFGAFTAPLVGLAGAETAWPMAIAIATLTAAAVLVFASLGRLRPAGDEVSAGAALGDAP